MSIRIQKNDDIIEVTYRNLPDIYLAKIRRDKSGKPEWVKISRKDGKPLGLLETMHDVMDCNILFFKLHYSRNS